MRLQLVLLAFAMPLAGCSSISSTRFASGQPQEDGVVYYLPKRDLKIEVKVASDKLSEVIIGLSDPYPDRDRGAYVLQFNPSLFGKHKLDIEVTPAGLLKSTKSSAEDRVSGLDGFGKLLGYARGIATLESTPGTPVSGKTLAGNCAVNGTHTYLYPLKKTFELHELCDGGLVVEVQDLGAVSQKDGSNNPIDIPNGKDSTHAGGVGHSGIFYRVGRPYRVTVRGYVGAAAIVNSPTGGDELFLPIAKTLFATNDASITFAGNDGIPTKYQQETDGEITALLKIPAVIVTPYFEAIGAVLKGISSRETATATARKDQIAGELAKQKQEACIAAIVDKDTATIEALACGK